MNISDLVPWRSRAVAHRENDPFLTMQQEFNHLFDNFFRRFDMIPAGDGQFQFAPRLNIAETEKDFQVTVELPGMDEKDIEVTLAHNLLTIQGEKKADKEEKDKNFYRHERNYGFFQRTIPLPSDLVDQQKVDAAFDKGILTVTLPKVEGVQPTTKRITVKAA